MTKKCYACNKLYSSNDYGARGKGGWRTCSPWCKFYDLRKMI